jgi:hypothetical protein
MDWIPHSPITSHAGVGDLATNDFTPLGIGKLTKHLANPLTDSYTVLEKHAP